MKHKNTFVKKLTALVLCLCMVLPMVTTGFVPMMALLDGIVPQADAYETSAATYANEYYVPSGTQFFTQFTIATKDGWNWGNWDKNIKEDLNGGGFTAIETDLNNGAGGHYIFMGYKKGTDQSKAIRRIAFLNGSSRPETYTYNGAVYYRVNGCWDDRSYTSGTVDLNRGAGGDDITMYYTTDPAAGPPMSNIDWENDTDNDGNECKEPAVWMNTNSKATIGNVADMNAGAKGDYIYFFYKQTGTEVETSVLHASITNGNYYIEKKADYVSVSALETAVNNAKTIVNDYNADGLSSAYDQNAINNAVTAITNAIAGLQTKVYYNGNGGTVSQSETTITIGGEASASHTPAATASRAGYTFLGWSTDKNATSGASSLTVGCMQTVYAVWKANNYNLYFNPMNGTVDTASKTVTYDAAYGDMPTPTREGYTFSGWYYEAACTNKVKADDKYKVAGDSTVYAGWQANKYELTINSAEGVNQTNLLYPDNKKTNAELAFNNDGINTFNGGNSDITYSGTIDADGVDISGTYKVVKNNETGNALLETTTMLPLWIYLEDGKTYEFSFTASNDKTSLYLFKDGESGIRASISKHEGNTYSGIFVLGENNAFNTGDTTWHTADDATGLYQLRMDQDHGLTVLDGTAYSYSISNLVIREVSAEAKSIYTQPAGTSMFLSAPTRNGYTFNGWSFSGTQYGTLNETPNGTLYTFGTNKDTLEANWNKNSYTLTYDAKGGSLNGVSSTVYTAEDLITIAAAPTKEGHSFLGWIVTSTDGNWIENGTVNPGETASGMYGNVTLTAQWQANSYTLTFKDADGTVLDTITGDYGTDITAPAAPTKEGYTFNGWSPEVPATMPAEDMTFTAQWTANSYTITFVDTDGSELYKIAEPYGTAITAPAEPTKDGYTFGGWDQTIPATMPAGDMTITATWTVNNYTVKFESDSTVLHSEEKAFGTTVDAIADPVKEGHAFDGWYVNDEKATFPYTVPVGGVTFTAKWKTNTYTLTYRLNETTDYVVVTYAYGADIVSPADPTLPGYTFKGWEPAIPEKMPANDVTVTAKWEINTHTVTYIVDGEQVNQETYAYGSDITAYTYEKRGYTFSGWDKEIPATMPDENLTFNGTTTEDKYTLTIDRADGTPTTPIEYTVNSDVITIAPVERLGYIFDGWAEEGIVGTTQSVTIDPSDVNTVLKDRTFVAQWQAANVNYTIKTYTMGTDGAYGDPTEEVKQAPTNSEIKIEVAAKEGFTAENKKVSGIVQADGSLVLEIRYQRHKYDVTLTPGEGIESLNGAGSYYYGARVTVSVAEFKPGYTTAAWTYSNTSTPAETSFYMPDHAVNLTATATADVYTIAYNLAGGAVAGTNPTSYTVKDSFTLINPTREGYTFAGWTGTGLTEATEKVEIATGSTGNRAYTATWTAIDYTISYNYDGGAMPEGVTNPETYNIETETFDLKKPTKVGYAFAGWTGTGIDDTADTVEIAKGSTGNREYTATWTASNAKYTVIYYTENLNSDDFSQHGETQVIDSITGTGIELSKLKKDIEGFTFNEAVDKDGNKLTADPTVAADSSTVVKLYYTRNIHTLTYYITKGDMEEAVVHQTFENVEFGAVLPTVEDPARTGYSFQGWKNYTSELTMPDANLDILATWDPNVFTITYDLVGGAFAADAVVPELHTYDTTTEIPDPAKTGYAFAGWKTGDKELGTGYIVKENDFTADFTLTATWTPIEQDYTVEYYFMDNKGAEYVLDSSKTKTDKLATGSVLELTPAEETGFILNEDKTELDIPMPAEGNLILKVYYDRMQYTLTLTAGEGVASVPVERKYYYQADVSFTASMKTGYAWSSWTNTADGTEFSTTQQQVFTMPAYDLSLTANATPITYTIKVDTMGGTLVSEFTKATYNVTEDDITVPDAVRTGYIFNGWSLNGAAAKTGLVIDTAMAVNVQLVASWTAEEYTIIYNGVENAVNTNPGKYTIETETFSLAEPTRTGYEFLGWTYGDVTEPTKDVTITKGSTGNLEFTARWQALGIEYNIVYHFESIATENYYDSVKNAKGSADAESTVQVSDIAEEKIGFKFKEAKLNENGAAVAEFVVGTVAGDTTIHLYYTRNSYTVSYNANGGSAVATQTYRFEQGVAAPADPSRTGYTFNGWTPALPETMPAENIEVTADWTVNNYTITFTNTGDSEIEKIDAAYGSEITAPADPTKTGYTFTGWSMTIPATMPAENLVIEATWKVNQYTITFDTDGGSAVEAITKNYGEAIGTVTPPTKEGYSFIAWDPAIPETMPAGDMTITATWKINQYTITFDTNGGSAVEAITKNYGEAIGTVTEPTKTGYTFDGWDVAIPETMPAGGMTITAKWKINQYTVTFYDDDKQTVLKTVTQDYGTSLDTSYKATKRGYNFVAWDKEIPAVMPAENITITASWTVINYDIIYNLDDGTNHADNPTTYTVEDNIKLKAPTKVGYTFKEWSPTGEIAKGSTGTQTFTATWEANKDTKYTIEYWAQTNDGIDYIPHKTVVFTGESDTTVTVVLDDIEGFKKPPKDVIEVYIKADGSTSVRVDYSRNQYTITFDTLGGSEVTGVTVFYDAPIVAPSVTPTKTGYTFAGWEALPEKMPAKDITVKATWTANSYEIKYEGLEDAEEFAKVTAHTYGSETRIDNPTRKGYTFKGWLVNDSVTPVTDLILAADAYTDTITLKADWSANNQKYTVIYYYEQLDGTYAEMSRTTDKEAATDSTVTLTPAETETGFTLNKEKSVLTGVVPVPGTTLVLSVYYNRNSYNVTWDVDGVTTTESYKYEQAIVKPADPQKTGYKFHAWTPEVPATMPAENKTFTAQFMASTDTAYKVIHKLEDLNADTYTEKETENLTGKTATEVTPSVKTYEGFSAPQTQTVTIAADGSTEVVYLYTRNSYKVTVVATDEGLSTPTKTQTLEYGDTLNVSVTVANGYKFLGWTSDNEKVNSSEAASYTITVPASDVTLTAKAEIIKYTIGYELDGGALAEGVTNPTEFYVTTEDFTLNKPTKRGYTFTGWTGSNGATSAETVTVTKGTYQNLNYTANWKVNQYNIAYNLDGGSVAVANPTSYTVNSASFKLNNPTKAGYEFAGWTGTDLTGAVTEVTIEANSIGHREYTATWAPKTQTYYVDLYFMDLNGAYPETTDRRIALTAKTAETVTYTMAEETGFTIVDGTNLTVVDGKNVLSGTIPATDLASEALVLEGYYSRDQHTVTLAGGDGIDSVSGAGTYYYGASVTVKAELMPGYAWVNWSNTDGTYDAQEYSFPMGTADVSLTANAEIIDFTISYDLDGGSVATENPTGYTVNTDTFTLVNPTRKGYTFLGWTGTDLNGYTTDVKVEKGSLGNRSYKANWSVNSYTLTIDPNGGIYNGNTEKTVLSFTVNDTIVINEPTRVGYTFEGWSDGTSTSKEITLQKVAEDRTYTAQWAADNDITYKVEHYQMNLNGKYDLSATETDVYENGVADSTVTPAVKAYTGFKAPDAQTVTVNPDGSTVVKYYYERNQYTLTYKLFDGATSEKTYYFDAPVDAAPATDVTGYTFTGWDKGIPTQMPAGNLEITGTWTVNQYTITFDTAGGTAIAPITQNYGTDIIAPAKPTKVGYEFAGWDKEIPATMPARNMTITAQWTVNSYTITFNTDGGTTIAPITADYGTAITRPANPTKTGYTFAGWNMSIPGTMPAENMTITALWKINQYTVTFNTNGGTEIESVTADYGTEIATPADPVKRGYTFKGWDAEIPETMPAENVTINANWEIITYTISYTNPNGAVIVDGKTNPTTYTVEDTIKLNALQWAGYSFSGWVYSIEGQDTETTLQNDTITDMVGNIKLRSMWSANLNDWYVDVYYMTTNGSYKPTPDVVLVNPNGSQQFTDYDVEYDLSDSRTLLDGFTPDTTNSITTKIISGTEETHLIAKYKRNQYTVVYKLANDANEEIKVDTYYEADLDKVTDPTRTGYTFAGWYDVNGNKVALPEKMPLGGGTYTAHWTANKYELTFVENGGTEVADITYTIESTDVLPEISRAGYTFNGWKVTTAGGSWTTADASYAAGTALKGTYGDATLEAQWTARNDTTYVVKHMFMSVDGQSFVEDETKRVEATGTSDTMVTPAVLGGDDIIGFTAPAAKTVLIKADGTTVVEYEYTRNQYKLTWVIKGSADETVPYYYGAAVAAKNAPELPGHKFNGWSRSIPATMPAEDVTITAKLDLITYYITIDYNGAQAVDNKKEYNVETDTFTLTNPTRDGYEFLGWTGSNGTTAQTNITIAKGSTGDRSYKAMWNAEEKDWFVDVYYMNTDGAYNDTPDEHIKNTNTTDTPVSFNSDTKLKDGFTFDAEKSKLNGTVPGTGTLTLIAKYIRQQYTVTYIFANGTDEKSVTTWYEAKLEEIAEPTRTGYTFAGWYDANGNKVDALPETMPLGGGTYTAHWTANSYTLTLDENGGTAVENITYDIEDTVTLPVLTRDGYFFQGWKVTTESGNWYNADENYSAGTPVSGKYGSATLTAQWTTVQYTLTFDTKGGTVSEASLSYTIEEDKQLPMPVRPGYTFDGWNVTAVSNVANDSGNVSWIVGNTYAAGTSVLNTYGNATFEAQWSANTYDVITDAANIYYDGATTAKVDVDYTATLTPHAGYTLPETITVTIGDKAAILNTDYTWTVNADGTATLTIKGASIIGDVAIKVERNIITYTISYNLDKATTDPHNATEYNVETAVTLTAPERIGYTFLGWTGSNGTTPETAVTIPVGSTGDKQYTANWQAKNQKWYVDVYYMNTAGKYNDTASESLEFTNTTDTPVSFNSADKLKDGFIFDAAESTLTGTVPGEGTLRLTAKYIRQQYTVTYNFENGAENVSVKDFYEAKLETVAKPTRTGYTFAGWMNSKGAIVDTLPETMPLNGETYTAQWTINNYTLTLVANGGTEVADIAYTIESTGALPTISRAGYAFAGWRVTTAGGSWTTADANYAAGTSVKGKYGSATLTAQWTPVTYTLAFNADNGTVTPASIAYSTEDATNVLPTPVRPGYTFEGWLVTEATDDTQSADYISWKVGNTYAAGTAVKGTYGNASFKAQWTANTYKVTANTANIYYDGAATATVDKDYTATLTPKPGYTLPDTITVTIGDKAAIINTDYTWTVNADGTATLKLIGASIIGNVEIKVVRNITTYTISYSGLENGKPVDGDSYTYSYTVETPTFTLPELERLGYTFDGWTGSNGDTAQHNIEIAVGSVGNRAYTANWTAKLNTCTVEHYQQNIYDNGYTLAEADTVTTQVATDKYFEPAVNTYPGFASPEAQKVFVKGDNAVTVKYYYDRETYTVTIDGSDEGIASVSGAGTYRYGYEVTAKATVSKGYAWAGWTNAADEKVSDDMNYTFTVGTENVALTANADIIDYAISYDLAGGTATNPTSYTVTTDTFTLSNPTRTGYTFAGWTGTGLTEATKTVTIANGSIGARSYTATWTAIEYTVSYNLNNGTAQGAMPTSYTIESETVILQPPVRNGYNFLGWVGSNGTTPDKNVSFAGGSIGDLSFEAQWEAQTHYYKVETYVMTTGGQYLNAPDTITDSIAAKTDDEITITPEAREGFMLDQTRSKLSGVVDYEDKLLLKVYYSRNQYDLTLAIATDGITAVTPAKTKVYYDADAEVLATIADGYTFAGWTSDNAKVADSTSNPYKFKMPAGDVTLTAKATLNTYTIRYSLNEGTNHAENKNTYTVLDTVVIKQPAKLGYTFTGWIGDYVTAGDAELTIPAGTTGDINLTANWQINTYSVTYDLAGGALAEGKTNPTSYTVKDSFTLNNPERVGYKFSGWQGTGIDGVNDTVTVNENKNTTGDLAFTAVWTANTDTKYTVNYWLMDIPSNGTERTYTKDEQASFIGTFTSDKEVTPALRAYTGFKTPAAQTKKVAADGSTVFNFYYERNIYTYTFRAEGYEDIVKEYYYEHPVTAPESPSRNGYTFEGWSPVVSATMPAANMVSVATWKAISYTIGYSLGGGTAENRTSYTVEDSFTLTQPTKYGYTFLGWTGSNGDTKQMTVEIALGSTGNRSYTAHWEATRYEIEYNLDGGTDNGANPLSYTIEDSITLVNPVKPGYRFLGWKGTGIAGTSSYVTFSEQTGKRTYTAQWTVANNTPYTVKHYQQDIGANTYTLFETESLTGTTLTTVNPLVKTYPGFTAPAVQSLTILPDGSASVEYYYTRNNYTIYFDSNGGTPVTSQTYAFDEAVTAPAAPSLLGYTFAGWTPALPEKMTAGNIYVTASWVANSDTPYTVYHYYQDTDCVSYPDSLMEIEYCYGETNAVVEVATRDKEGFTSPATRTVVIAADGSRTVRYYYTRNTYTVTFVDHNDQILDLQSVVYGLAATAPELADRAPDADGHYTFLGWSEDISFIHGYTTIKAMYSAEAHNPGADATCTEGLYCVECGYEIAPADGHMPVVQIPAVDPTCDKPGNTADSVCSVCGEVLSRYKVIPALGHDIGSWYVDVPATTTETGILKRVCSRCDWHETHEIPVLSDTPVADIDITTSGSQAYVGSTYQLVTAIKPANAGNKQVLWESSDPDIASVTADGMITSHKPGSVTFTVTTLDGLKTDSITINFFYSADNYNLIVVDLFACELVMNGKVVASEGATAQIIRVKAGDTLAFTLNPTTTEYLNQGGYILTANGSNVAPDANGVYYIYNVHENIEISALPTIGKPEFDDDQQYDTDEVPEKSIFAKILEFFERIMDWFRNLFK